MERRYEALEGILNPVQKRLLGIEPQVLAFPTALGSDESKKPPQLTDLLRQFIKQHARSTSLFPLNAKTPFFTAGSAPLQPSQHTFTVVSNDKLRSGTLGGEQTHMGKPTTGHQFTTM